MLLSGSELLIQGVNVSPTRAGLLDVLERMGARIGVFNRRKVGGEAVADLEVRSTPLVATRVEHEEVPRLVDELPLVALLGAFAHGTTHVNGAEELRAKETDRIETVTEALRAIGVHITANPRRLLDPRRAVAAARRHDRRARRPPHRHARRDRRPRLARGRARRGRRMCGDKLPGFYDLLSSSSSRARAATRR